MRWKDVEGYEGIYQVSDTGLVRSLDRVSINKTKNGKDRPCKLKGRILKPHTRKDGRLSVAFSKNGKLKTFSVHVLVAKSFVEGERDGLEINHKDGDYTNNHYTNLEWVTKTENIRHSFYSGIMPTSKKVALLKDDGSVEKVYPSEAQACRDNGIAQGKIGRAIRRNGTSLGRKWKYVDESVTTTEKWVSPTE